MTYTEYRSAIAGDEQNYTALFDTAEQRTAFIDAIRAGGEAIRDLKDCRNELCLRCGKYKMAHKGACEGCRWERQQDGKTQ